MAVLLAVVVACGGGGSPTTEVQVTATSTPGGLEGSSANPTTNRASSTSPSQALELEGRIIFTRAGGTYGDETIFLANADGSDERQLTENGANCCPRVSPDGTRILFSAFVGDRVTTAIQDLDGSNYYEFTLPDTTISMGPGAWSPDGTRIAVEVWDPADPSRDGIYTVDAEDASDMARVTDTQLGTDIPGDFSPDGTRLAFFRESDDIQSVGSIWVVNVDGTGAHQISPPDLVPGWSSIRWSPDGHRIIFREARTSPRNALWTIDPDGTDLTKIYEDPDGRFAITPTWSPDGSMVMFALDPIGDEFSHPANGMFVIRADGTGLTEVIGGDDFKRNPEWVP